LGRYAVALQFSKGLSENHGFHPHKLVIFIGKLWENDEPLGFDWGYDVFRHTYFPSKWISKVWNCPLRLFELDRYWYNLRERFGAMLWVPIPPGAKTLRMKSLNHIF
jgi:hypothetical protein